MTDESASESDAAADDGSQPYDRQLRDIFVATTDVEGFTETQDERATSRGVADEESASVSEAVVDIARADGLTDTYADPVYKRDNG
jgi:hypothetical protein